MEIQEEDVREWFYTLNEQRKGPVPTVVLSRLLEKGVGVSAQTLVWTSSMEQEWKPMHSVGYFY